MRHSLLILPFATLALSQCVMDGTGGTPLEAQVSQAGSQSLTATRGTGTVTIREGSRVLSVIRTASPNVEETRWHKNHQQIAVKSRGNHGPATVQLFDSRTGAQKGRVLAYEITSGKPAWAAGMAE